MSDVIETINKSMQQTTDCQEIARRAIEYCEILVDKVNALHIENEFLKQQLEGN